MLNLAGGVAVDLGGVIEDTWLAKQAWLAAHGHRFEQPQSRRALRQALGGPLHTRMLQEVYTAEAILQHPPLPGAVPAIKALMREQSVVVLTTRAASLRATVQAWLGRVGLSELAAGLVMIGDNALPELGLSRANKLDWCGQQQIACLIDDDLRHLEPLDQQAQVLRVHMNREGRMGALADNLYRVRDWSELQSHLRQWLGRAA